MKLGKIVGCALVSFLFVYGTILLFGTMQASLEFKGAYFTLMILVLGIVYFFNRKTLNGKLEHILTVVLILVVSTAFASAAGNFKDYYDGTVQAEEAKQGTTQELGAIQAQNAFYTKYLSYLTNQTTVLASNNIALQNQLVALSANSAGQDQQDMQATLLKMQEQYQAQVDKMQGQINQQQAIIKDRNNQIQSLYNQVAQLQVELQAVQAAQTPVRRDD
jgi:hypothetical protein